MEISTNTLTKTDVQKRLAIKSRSLKHLPEFPDGQYVQYLKVEDFEDQKNWSFKLITRRTRYRKPVLSSGWRTFVKSKNLQIGDQVMFLREEDEANGERKYKIKVIRRPPVTLFGVAIHHAPPSSAAF